MSIFDQFRFSFVFFWGCQNFGPNRYYYYYVIRTLGTTTDKIDRRTDRHTENKHKTTHYR